MRQRIRTDPKTWSSPDPTAPVIENRVPVFAPNMRVSHNSPSRKWRYETPWGWVELAGPVLNMTHWAILKMAMAMAVEKRIFKETGGMAVLFDAYEVKKALGYEGGSGHKRFIGKILELRLAGLRVHSNRTGRTRESGIIDSHSYDESPTQNLTKNRKWMLGYEPKEGENQQKTKEKLKNMAKGGMALYEICISPNYMQFFNEELRVHYDSLVPEILRISDGTIQAIIPFFLTHSNNCRFSIRQVIEIIGGIEEGMAKSTVSEIMSKPEKFKTELENFGIFVEGETIRYERHPKVFFTNPPESNTGAVIDAEQEPELTPEKVAMGAIPEVTVRPEAPVK